MLWVKNSIHMLWWMVLSYFSAAALISVSGHSFLPWILLLVYVGAIVILFLFALFMLEEVRASKNYFFFIFLFLFFFFIFFTPLSYFSPPVFALEFFTLVTLYDQFLLPFFYILLFLFLALFAVAFIRL